ncbi:hypothetical protein [Nocardia sp. NPDC057227]|uniref:hypothetical protein n=1 Tax=Nocardia sp. NPDC057227 TaxID=3346056 RepID=UPI00362A455D
MITDEDRQTAGMVLAKCAANDPWFPAGGESTVLAWAEVFSESGLGREDLLAGVARAYRVCEDGFRPLPASVVRHARAAYFEQLKSLPEDRRQLMERANHVLQDMGFAPPVAHRWARRVALGRSPNVNLTEDQIAEFKKRMAEREAIEQSPPRPMGEIEFGRSVDEEPDEPTEDES